MSQFSNIGRARVIDDSNYRQFLRAGEPLMVGNRGYVGRNYETHPLGKVGYASRFALDIPDRSTWPEMIKDIAAAKARLKDLFDYRKMQVLNQGQTNFCWVNGVIMAYMMGRARAGLPHLSLSPASVACKITNFKNEGGWGGWAIEGINKFGICTTDIWPANAIDRRYDTPETKQYAARHKVSEWLDLKPKSFGEVAACLLAGWAVPAGLMWWGHLICYFDLVQIGRDDFGVLFPNSWGPDWEDHGFGVLHESKATPDEANAIRVVAATGN